MKRVKRKVRVSKKFIIWSTCFIVFFVAIYFIQLFIFPQIKLNGGKKIIVEYKELYKE